MLIPKLEKATDQGEEARVLTVLSAGQNGILDLDDLGVKVNYGLKRKADAATSYNDLTVEVRHREMSV
jgi:hypothetical protein